MSWRKKKKNIEYGWVESLRLADDYTDPKDYRSQDFIVPAILGGGSPVTNPCYSDPSSSSSLLDAIQEMYRVGRTSNKLFQHLKNNPDIPQDVTLKINFTTVKPTPVPPYWEQMVSKAGYESPEGFTLGGATLEMLYQEWIQAGNTLPATLTGLSKRYGLDITATTFPITSPEFAIDGSIQNPSINNLSFDIPIRLQSVVSGLYEDGNSENIPNYTSLIPDITTDKFEVNAEYGLLNVFVKAEYTVTNRKYIRSVYTLVSDENGQYVYVVERQKGYKGYFPADNATSGFISDGTPPVIEQVTYGVALVELVTEEYVPNNDTTLVEASFVRLFSVPNANLYRGLIGIHAPTPNSDFDESNADFGGSVSYQNIFYKLSEDELSILDVYDNIASKLTYEPLQDGDNVNYNGAVRRATSGDLDDPEVYSTYTDIYPDGLKIEWVYDPALEAENADYPTRVTYEGNVYEGDDLLYEIVYEVVDGEEQEKPVITLIISEGVTHSIDIDNAYPVDWGYYTTKYVYFDNASFITYNDPFLVQRTSKFESPTVTEGTAVKGGLRDFKWFPILPLMFNIRNSNKKEEVRTPEEENGKWDYGSSEDKARSYLTDPSNALCFRLLSPDKGLNEKYIKAYKYYGIDKPTRICQIQDSFKDSAGIKCVALGMFIPFVTQSYIGNRYWTEFWSDILDSNKAVGGDINYSFPALRYTNRGDKARGSLKVYQEQHSLEDFIENLEKEIDDINDKVQSYYTPPTGSGIFDYETSELKKIDKAAILTPFKEAVKLLQESSDRVLTIYIQIQCETTIRRVTGSEESTTVTYIEKIRGTLGQYQQNGISDAGDETGAHLSGANRTRSYDTTYVSGIRLAIFRKGKWQRTKDVEGGKIVVGSSNSRKMRQHDKDRTFDTLQQAEEYDSNLSDARCENEEYSWLIRLNAINAYAYHISRITTGFGDNQKTITKRTLMYSATVQVMPGSSSYTYNTLTEKDDGETRDYFRRQVCYVSGRNGTYRFTTLYDISNIYFEGVPWYHYSSDGNAIGLPVDYNMFFFGLTWKERLMCSRYVVVFLGINIRYYYYKSTLLGSLFSFALDLVFMGFYFAYGFWKMMTGKTDSKNFFAGILEGMADASDWLNHSLGFLGGMLGMAISAVIAMVGFILSPFTGGASMVIANMIIMAINMIIEAKQRQVAADIEEEEKKMEKEYEKYEQQMEELDVNAQIYEDVYDTTLGEAKLEAILMKSSITGVEYGNMLLCPDMYIALASGELSSTLCCSSYTPVPPTESKIGLYGE